VRGALALAIALFACTPAEGPAMRPGQDCLSCHNASHEFTWSAAGTVFPALDSSLHQGVAGVTVELTDSDGKTVVLHTTESGDFYTAEALRFPLHSTVRYAGAEISMPTPTPSGSCNVCHTSPPPDAGTFGRLHLP